MKINRYAKRAIKISAFILSLCVVLSLVTLQLRVNLEHDRKDIFGASAASVRYNGKYECVYPWDIGSKSHGWHSEESKSYTYECKWHTFWVDWSVSEK